VRTVRSPPTKYHCIVVSFDAAALSGLCTETRLEAGGSRRGTTYVTPILSPSAVSVSRLLLNSTSILLSGILGSFGGGGQEHENRRWGSWKPGGAGGAARWRTYLAGICAAAAATRREGKRKGRVGGPRIDGKRRCGEYILQPMSHMSHQLTKNVLDTQLTKNCSRHMSHQAKKF
jgi:hypothetical protein